MALPNIASQIRVGLNIVAAAMLLSALSPLLAAELINDTAIGFSLKLPDGFARDEEIASSIPNMSYVFVFGERGDGQLDIILFIEKLPGVLGRDRVKPERLPPGSSAKYFVLNWQGFELDGIEIPEEAEGIKTLTYNVPIPLKRAGIQLKLFGPADRKADMERLLKEVLAGLSGESNWLASSFPGEQITSSENYGILSLIVGGLIVVGGLVILHFVSKWTSKGTVLAIAAGVYAASYQLEHVRIREVIMLSGAFRMLGFAGLILGAIDLRRKQKAQK